MIKKKALTLREKQDAYIKWHYGEVSAAEIGKRIGLSQWNVIARAKKMQLRSSEGNLRKKLCRVTIKRLIALGHSANEIADFLGVGNATIRRIAKKEFMESTIEQLNANGRRARDYGKRAVSEELMARSRS